MMSELHKWVATVAAVGVLLWGSMAYFITAEDAKMKLAMEARINQLEQQQLESAKMSALVISIDKKLAVFEVIIKRQATLVANVREIRTEMNELKFMINKKEHNNASSITFSTKKGRSELSTGGSIWEVTQMDVICSG